MAKKTLIGIWTLIVVIVVVVSWAKFPENVRVKPDTSLVGWVDHYSSLEDMIEHSDLIIKGKMIKNNPKEVSGMIFSMEEMKISKVYKDNNKVGDSIIVQQTGGVLNGTSTQAFPEAPLMDKKREYILFLKNTKEGYFVVMGGYQGLGKIINGKLDLNFVGDPVTDKLQGMTVKEIEKQGI